MYTEELEWEHKYMEYCAVLFSTRTNSYDYNSF